MKKFDLRKAILENRATFFSSIGEEKQPDKSNKIKKSELKEMIKSALLDEINLNVTDENEGYDFLSEEWDEDYEKIGREVEYGINPYQDEETWSDFEDDEEVETMEEADKKDKEDIEDTEEIDIEDPMDGEDIEVTDTETSNEISPEVKSIQNSLTQAQSAAKKLGDQKLIDQIGNTITFFTRSHIASRKSNDYNF